MRTSPSSALRLTSAFDRAISAARSDKTLGAGQRATVVHGLEIERDDWRWGHALYPAEPISQVIAALQNDYSYFTWRLSLWWPVNHPFADIRIDELGNERAQVNDYLQGLLHKELPGIYTEAQTMDQLEALLTAPAPTTGRIDYAALKDRISIVDYIGRYVQLRKTGARYKGKCPFHDERTASFVVYPETRSFYCFGCMAAGDVIDFAKLAHGSLPQVA